MPSRTSTIPVITGSMFYQYLACPHWLYFEFFGDQSKKAKLSPFHEMLLERGVLHEKKILEGLLLESVPVGTNEERFEATTQLMSRGVERIYHGLLMHDDMVGEPDILEKRTDRISNFGSYYYVPVDIKNSDRLADTHRFQLLFYAELLGAVQGILPDEACIINSSGARLGFSLREYQSQYHAAFNAIRDILSGQCPPPHLTSGCKQSPWFRECIVLAEKQNDIALLYNVKQKTLDAFRGDGIATVADVAVMDPRRVHARHHDISEKTLRRLQSQATALIEHRHIVREPVVFPESTQEIYFDIEGDPLRDVDYLLGFLLVDHDQEKYHAFLAKKPEDEEYMWREFLLWIETVAEQTPIYHYGIYELTRLTILERRYGGSSRLKKFLASMVDLNEVVKDAIVFPLYFYSLKDIGSYIGYERSKKISGGGESVAYYEDWLTQGDQQKLDAILLYNEDDVRATRMLKTWLLQYGK